jgi:plastocyanin
MNKRTIIPVVIALIVLGGAGVLVVRRGTQSSQLPGGQAITQPRPVVIEDNSQPSIATASQPAHVPQPSETQPPVVSGRFSGEVDIEGSDVQVFQIVYDGLTFSPETITIKNGDVVIFKNKSKVMFRPASNPHPSHAGYPAFDAKQPVPGGQSYQFKFTQVGTWKFHDHLHPDVHGSVTVVP